MEFDKLVHQPTRLQIFAYLYRHDRATFSELQDELGITDGNLSGHIQRMEEADAVTVEKQFVDRRPQTTYELTADGRATFESHVETLETLLEQLEGDSDSVESDSGSGSGSGSGSESEPESASEPESESASGSVPGSAAESGSGTDSD